jgi:hypothetical protein
MTRQYMTWNRLGGSHAFPLLDMQCYMRRNHPSLLAVPYFCPHCRPYVLIMLKMPPYHQLKHMLRPILAIFPISSLFLRMMQKIADMKGVPLRCYEKSGKKTHGGDVWMKCDPRTHFGTSPAPFAKPKYAEQKRHRSSPNGCDNLYKKKIS